MNDTPQRGFSLSAMFVLVTASATLIAGFTPLVRLASEGRVPLLTIGIAVACGFGLGVVLGTVVGSLQFRQQQGALAGMWAGGIVGIAAALIALLPTQSLGTAAVAMLIGSALIVAVALFSRRANG